MLTLRFGPLSASTIHRVRAADTEQVRTWVGRFANNPDFAEILDSQTPIEPFPCADSRLLEALMLIKFGPLPFWLDADIRWSDAQQIQTWTDRFLIGGNFEHIIYGEEEVSAWAEAHVRAKNLIETWAADKAEAEGRAEALLDLLTVKFGTLPEHITDTVQAANLGQLEAWTGRILSVATLDDVFTE